MVYLLDANVFIQAKNLHYGFDFCPAFWDWIIDQNAKGRVNSIEKIGDELEAGQDDLATWAKERGDGFFLKPDQDILKSMPTVSTWVKGQKYQPAAVNTFFQVADYWLVAHALSHKCTVVTHEIASNGITKVKIPNVCIGVKVKCMTPYEMLRHERAKFVLGKQP
jgi:hypothetical protein